MYRHILIPTDGSELAEHAVTNGLSLAKSVGAKITVIIVEEPFDWLSVPETRASQRQALDKLAEHKEQVEKTHRECTEWGGRCSQAGRCALRHDAGSERVTLSSHYCNGLGQGL